MNTWINSALGILNRNSKTILNALRKFGITCSYDEVEILKKYADGNAAKEGYHNGGPKVNHIHTVLEQS